MASIFTKMEKTLNVVATNVVICIVVSLWRSLPIATHVTIYYALAEIMNDF